MKNFIKLTSEEGEEVYVNPNHVCYMKKHENGTRLYFSPDDDHTALDISESLERVRSLASDEA